jgi:hypothetical protein
VSFEESLQQLFSLYIQSEYWRIVTHQSVFLDDIFQKELEAALFVVFLCTTDAGRSIVAKISAR